MSSEFATVPGTRKDHVHCIINDQKFFPAGYTYLVICKFTVHNFVSMFKESPVVNWNF